MYRLLKISNNTGVPHADKNCKGTTNPVEGAVVASTSIKIEVNSTKEDEIKSGTSDLIVATTMENKLRPEIFDANFDKTGKIEFFKYLKQQLKENQSPIQDKNNEFDNGISSALYDLLWSGLKSTIKKDVILATLNEVVQLHEDLSSVILDIFNILDAETSLMTDGIQEERLMFTQLLKDLDKLIPDKLIKERLEIDTLQEVGVVKNKVFYTKFIKIKTKLYYKQRRFNLFREETEGYAKLITELNQEYEVDNFEVSKIMDVIRSLIGCFNLDPNRVLDIILETFESRPSQSCIFIPLLREYMSHGSIICEILGYKFRYFDAPNLPLSLLNLCALLLKNNVIDLDSIYVWLTPIDEEIKEKWNSELHSAKEYVRKLHVIITNKDAIEPEPEVVADVEAQPRNQKFGLCEALLKLGDWENAKRIIDKLPEQCVVVNQNIADSLSELIDISIDHLYLTKAFKMSNSSMLRKEGPKGLAKDEALVERFQAKEFKDLRKVAIPMIVALGPSLHHNTVLLYKIIRILRTIITEMGVDSLNGPPHNTESENLYYEIMTIMDASVLPSLSYLDCNCPVAEEVWNVLKYFPYHFRYSLYARWKNETYLLHPQMIRRRGDAQKKIKALMKRVSKENVKPVGRSIGKLSHCAPGFLFDYILLQIQIYDNLIGPVVDSLKYLTSLSFDCLGYCIIESLTMCDRNRFKLDCTSISLWLQSLASFCGAIYKKYNIELSGLLQYVANQLKCQRSLDLLILKEIVQKMAGVESAEEMTNEQLNAMCGGELLRGEAGYFSQVRNTKKSSQRLKDALANNDLAVGICLLMAQQKHCVIYRETAESHLKLVGKLYDQCQDTLVQFGTFLGSSYTVDEYVERLPSIITMLQDYHINTDVAFFLARPMFTHQINQKYDQLRKADPNAKKLTTSQKLQKYLEATDLIMSPIVESVKPLHGIKVWEDISPQFLVTFWSLSMYDLQVPSDSYQKEISKLKQLSQQAADAKDSNASKNKKEQERYIALMDKLQDERKKQQEHVDKVLQRLQQQKDNWFLSRSAKSAKNETITQFLQLCVLPRCTFTAIDALYCAKFIHTIHYLKAANFSTLLCYDRIFCDVTYTLTSCTENEATRYGRFLCALLETLMRWHGDQAIFNKECANFPGFVTKFRVSNQFSESNDHVGYENYRHVCHKWHYKITKSMVFCLDSKDYMQTRNALIILMRILPYYPVLTKLSQIIERKVEKVRDEEKNKRQDLFVIASSYIGQLKTKASAMIKESDFHQVADKTVKAELTSNLVNDITGTPQANTVNLNDVSSLNHSSSPIPNTEEEKPTSVLNGEVKIEKREVRERSEKPKVILKNFREPVKIGNTTVITSCSASSHRNITLIEIKDEPSVTITNAIVEEEPERRSTIRTIKNERKEDRSREREREREPRERDIREKETRERETREREIREREIRDRETREREVREIRDRDTPREREIRDRDVREREPREREARERDIRERDIRERDIIREREPREREIIEREPRERVRERITVDDLDVGISTRILKRREERYRNESPVDNVIDDHYERNDRVRDRERERDLSSVSNESNAGEIHRRMQENLDVEKDSKRRKLDLSSSSVTSKKIGDDYVEKKIRVLRVKDRKEKVTEEEKDARKERKLGRKRERLEETNLDHKRRREVENGDDIRERDINKYHSREKSPHFRPVRERSHDKFERERAPREERQYGNVKTTRSRIPY